MKIVHPSGQAYDLPADFRLEMSRSNPFFHKTGEQSLPCSLPPSRRNMELLEQPHLVANKHKIPSRLDVTIENGVFFLKARQAILNAKRGQPVQTSFYLNESTFYERVKSLTLQSIFEGKSIQFNNIDSAVSFVFTLMSKPDERFGCFQVFCDGRELNRVDHINTSRFYHSIDRSETVDEKVVNIPRGMFITPFIKVRHVISEVAAYLGYSLDVSFLDNVPFNNMVFMNNNSDTIMLGRIDYVDIVPDLTLEEFFDVLRKFNCEVIPDETTKKLKIIRFDDVYSEKTDISKQLIDELQVAYHNDYKQIRLTSKILNIQIPDKIFEGYEPNAMNEFTTLSDIAQKYPSARVSNSDGSLYRAGFKGESEVKQRVGTLHCNFHSGDNLTDEEKKIPDTISEIVESIFIQQASEGGAITGWDYLLYPYVGTIRALKTQLVFDDENTNTENLTSPEYKELEPMLCLYYFDEKLGFNVGTIHNYNATGQRLWDYTLAYNGIDGIFEKFWRKYDDLLRNALLEVSGQFLLTETQKMMLSSHKSVMIDSQVLLPSIIKYIPGENIPQECSFFTTKLQHPISSAPSTNQYFKNYTYKWVLKVQRNFTNPIPGGAVEIIKYKTAPVAYFPENPTEAEYNSGGKYYEKKYEVDYGYGTLMSFTKRGEGIITTWLEPVLA